MNGDSEHFFGSLADATSRSPPTLSDETQFFEITASEFAFAVLVDSFDVAVQPLSDLVIAAVKANNPVTWKETICACFSIGMKQHVKDGLENDSSLGDIFVVCKVISCRLNDVSVYVGGDVLDAAAKERLSLEVQGVAAARHWAFHGEFISLQEVHSSLHHLISILTRLRCGQTYIKKLQCYVEYIEETYFLKPETQCSLSLITACRTLLYRSIGEFERGFLGYFHQQAMIPGNRASERQELLACFEEKIDDSSKFCLLIKAIQRELSATKRGLPSSSELERCTNGRVSCSKKCKYIASMRIKFAHNKPVAKEDTVQTLHGISEILTAFGLCCNQTKAALASLNCLKEDAEKVWCEVRWTIYCSKAFSTKRILRPEISVFVGRKQETLLIKEHLTSYSHLHSDPDRCTGEAVLLFGCAGIGKSYLANKLACDLRTAYPKQKWLCCSSEEELQENISLCLEKFSACRKARDEYEGRASRVFSTAQGRRSASSSKTFLHWLYVLDDVSSMTVLTVSQILLTTSHCFILTTRSNTVKDLLLRWVSSLLVITLQPFSQAESCELLKRKTKSKIKEQALLQASETAQHILGNLPLCVNIFSSLQATRSMREGQSTFPSSLDETLSFCDWEKIETEFSDRHHVRGLSGILQIAQKFIEDRPLVLFFLAKIALCMQENIPWQVVTKIASSTHFLPETFIWSNDVLRCLFEDLKKIVDWLFSCEGEVVLASCRDVLEQLGLITWDKQTVCLHIHGLMIKGVKMMLSENNLFFHKLLSFFLKTPNEEDLHDQAAENLSTNFQTYLMCEILSNSMEFLKTVASVLNYKALNNRNLQVYTFLAHLLDSKVFQQVAMATNSANCRVLLISKAQSLISSCLFDYAAATGVNDARMSYWIDLYQAFPLRQDKLEFMLLVHNSIVGMQSVPLYRESLCPKISEMWIKNFIKFVKPHSNDEVYWHCILACKKEDEGGPQARTLYLTEASKECPRLLTEPNLQVIKSELVCLQQMRRSLPELNIEHFQLRERLMRLQMWRTLLGFQIRDQLAENGKVYAKAAEQASSLIEVVKELQKLCLDFTKPAYTCKRDDLSKLHILHSWSDFAQATVVEAGVWTLLQKLGKSLRVMVQSVHKSLYDFYLLQLADSEIIQTPPGVNVWEESMHLYLGRIYVCCWDVSHFQLANNIMELLHPFFERSHYYLLHQSRSMNCQSTQIKCFRNYQVNHHMRKGDILFLRAKTILCNTLQAEPSLHFCLLSLKAYLCCLPNSHYIYPSLLDENLTLIPLLCALLGEEKCLEVLSELRTLTERSQSSAQNGVLQQLIKNIKELPWITDARNIYQLFSETMWSFQRKDFLTAQVNALSCLVSLLHSNFARADKVGQWMLTEMHITLADILRQISTSEKDYDKVKQQCRFLLKFAKWKGKLFPLLKYRSFFVDYLRRTQQFSEALKQARLLQICLTEEFGEDYLEWLPDAPNAFALCKDLEKEMAK